MASNSCCLFLQILFAIILPPVGVILHYGCCSIEFWICLLLTILGYIPGIIYAIYVLIAARPRGQYHRPGYNEPLV